MTTTTNRPSGLPEQEPTSPTAVVLCDDKSWVNAGAGWETRTQWLGTWGDLRVFAAERGGATLYDLADLTTGLTEVQKEAVRSIESKFLTRGGIAAAIRNAFPEAFADDLVTATWKPGDSDEKLAELLRVAKMEGAHAVIERGGDTHSGSVRAGQDNLFGDPFLDVGTVLSYRDWPHQCDGTITVTAPKPVDPTGGDPVVLARSSSHGYKRVCFLAEDGTWSPLRGDVTGMYPTDSLAEIERLSAQTIAELMGGAA